jgi:RND family efflux transporter MFP subunit
MRWLYSNFFKTFACLLLAFVLVQTSLQANEIPMAQVVKRQLPSERILDGQLEAVHQATVSSQTRGRVIKINFDVGDYVSKGDPLIQFRAKDQQAQFDAAKAGYAEAQAEYERIKEVYGRKLVAKAALDKAEARFKAARAALDQAKEALENTLVRAPYSGIVVKRHIEQGELANVGQKLMTGLSLESLRTVVEVPQSIIQQVREHKAARVILPQGDSLQATRLTISPKASEMTHTFTVRVDLPEGDHHVYPGMFTKVAFVVGQEERLLIPAQAVAHRGEVNAVYVKTTKGGLALQQVMLGRKVGDDIIVLSGLSENDQVALDPVQAAAQVRTVHTGE